MGDKMDALNGKLATGWGDPTWWQSPDKRIGFSIGLFQNSPNPATGQMITLRGGTIFADAVNFGALKALLKMALDAVEKQEKRIVGPNQV